MVGRAVQTNHLPFGYVVADTWYASKENMSFLKEELGRDFVLPLKSNRKVALSHQDKLAGCWRKVDALKYQENATRQVWLEGVGFSAPSRQASLYKQRWQRRCALPGGQQHFQSDLRRTHGDLPETVESRGIPQKPQAERFSG